MDNTLDRSKITEGQLFALPFFEFVSKDFPLDANTIALIAGHCKPVAFKKGSRLLETGADGKYIYFNSYRSGHMQIWRMLADGTLPEQLTFDGNSNWFAHPSPDNNFVVYIA